MVDFSTTDFAAAYDAVISWDQRLARELPFIIQQLLPETTLILDSACGTGHHVKALLPYTRRIIGLDSSPSMIARALYHNQMIEHPGHPLLLISSLSHLPLRDGLMDAILTLGASLPLLDVKELEQALEASCAALKESGVYLFQTRNFQLVAQQATQNAQAKFLPVRQGTLQSGHEVIFLRFYDVEITNNMPSIQAINFIFLVHNGTTWNMTTSRNAINPITPTALSELLTRKGFHKIDCYDGYHNTEAEGTNALNLVYVLHKS